MNIERVENIHIKNVNDVSLESGNHTSSEKRQMNTEKIQNISISESRPRQRSENSTQEERMSRKSEQIDQLNNERSLTISINVPQEKEKSPRIKKTLYKKRYFCCGTLADGAIASANYTNVISVIIILSSLHLFFRNSKDDDGINKALSFCAVIYATCYIQSSKNLKRAISEEQREKIIPWILFSILTIFLLLSASIYVSVTYWEELDDFDEDLTVPCLRLILIAFLAFVGCTLIYCTYGVIRLFQSMAQGEVAAYSLMNDIRAFINGVSV